jgi:hypothetical protein
MQRLLDRVCFPYVYLHATLVDGRLGLNVLSQQVVQ